MQLSVLVSADYVVQVEVLSYSNPFNRRSDGQCCDSSREECSGVDLCDTYFIYCLMPHASTAEGCSNNKTGDILVTSFITDGADIDFSQPIVLGLSNPFNLTGISTAWEVLHFNILLCLLHFNLLSFAGSSTLHTSA